LTCADSSADLTAAVCWGFVVEMARTIKKKIITTFSV